MASALAARLAERGLALPPAHAPGGNYVGWVRTGDLLWVAGQGPVWGKEVRYSGRLGDLSDLPRAEAAARLTFLNLLAVAALAPGGLAALRRCVKVQGLVSAVPDAADIDALATRTTAFVAELFGDPPALTLTGVPGLPVGITVELDGIFEVVP